MKQKVKFLTVVWGESYINRFCTLSLPSFLAPGNIPALEDRTELEVVIMTRQGDFGHFEKQLAFKRLSRLCKVRFVAIDDLIATTMYGVTLTLAYARPIIACGQEMLETYFVFMNADFVLADGSLQGLFKHIDEGRSIVLAPSFRSNAEDLEPILEDYVDADTATLSMPPRKMVELSLAHPHQTTIAKYQNQALLFSTHPNQFFWPVDEHTCLGRYYLIFMLALKPERIIKSINSYCDYGLIPELCPSGDEVAMGDSDDFFMLELQNREQELRMLRIGRMPVKKIARSLQYWTTKEHRRAASHDIVFHARDIPPEINKAKQNAKEFIEQIDGLLKTPVSHIHHKYWSSGVMAWKAQLRLINKVSSPPELAPHRVSLFSLKHTLQSWISSKYIDVTNGISHSPYLPSWIIYQLIKRTIASLDLRADSTLFIGDKNEWVWKLLPDGCNYSADIPGKADGWGGDHPKSVAKIVVLLAEIDAHKFDALNKLFATLDEGSSLSIILHPKKRYPKKRNPKNDIHHLFASISNAQIKETWVISVGGPVHWFLNRVVKSLYSRIYTNYGGKGVIIKSILAVGILISMVISRLQNVYLNITQPINGIVKGYSCLVIELRK